MVIQTLQKQLEQKFNFMKNIIKLKSLSNIVDKYDSYDRDTWEEGDWDNMPYMLYNITN